MQKLNEFENSMEQNRNILYLRINLKFGINRVNGVIDVWGKKIL